MLGEFVQRGPQVVRSRSVHIAGVIQELYQNVHLFLIQLYVVNYDTLGLLHFSHDVSQSLDGTDIYLGF